jgi:hypothetical protein
MRDPLQDQQATLANAQPADKKAAYLQCRKWFCRPAKVRFKGRLIYKIANRVSRNPGAHTDRPKRPFIYKIGEPRKAAKSRLFTTLQVVNRGIRTLSSDDFYDPSYKQSSHSDPFGSSAIKSSGSSPDGYVYEARAEVTEASLKRRELPNADI